MEEAVYFALSFRQGLGFVLALVYAGIILFSRLPNSLKPEIILTPVAAGWALMFSQYRGRPWITWGRLTMNYWLSPRLHREEDKSDYIHG